MRQAEIRIHEHLEDVHWWFAGRRRVILALLKRFVDVGDGYLLDAGCGTGGNLKYLTANGYRLVGLEPNPQMANIARRKSGCKVYQDELATGLRTVREDIRVVLLLDVLEHVEDDLAALCAVHSRLPCGAQVLVTVPAFPFLWSRHDESFGHYRRYTIHSLRQKMTASGFAVAWISYFNSLLFPLAACTRIVKTALGSGGYHTDFWMPPELMNTILTHVLGSESLLTGLIRWPFGLSLQSVARRC